MKMLLPVYFNVVTTQEYFPISLSSVDNLSGQISKASTLEFKIKTKQRDTFFHSAKLRKALL